MQKFNYLIIPVIILLFFGCDKIKEVSTVDIETDLEKDLIFSISETDPSSVNENFSISATDNTEIARYRENIREITINRVYYQVIEYSGTENVLLTGTLELGPIDIQVEDLNLNAMYNTGQENELDLFETELRQLADDLDVKDKVDGSLTGNVSDKPLTFAVRLIMDVEFRAAVL